MRNQVIVRFYDTQTHNLLAATKLAHYLQRITYSHENITNLSLIYILNLKI